MAFESPELDPILIAVVRQKARSIVGKEGITDAEAEDIEQEICAHLVGKFSVGDADSPRGMLLETIVDNRLRNILRNRRAKKRKPPSIISLSIIVDYLDDEGPVELSDTISDRENDARRGIRRRSDQELVDLAHDEAVARAKLGPTDQEIWDRLKFFSVADVAVQLGIPRTTLNDRIARWLSIRAVKDLEKFL